MDTAKRAVLFYVPADTIFQKLNPLTRIVIALALPALAWLQKIFILNVLALFFEIILLGAARFSFKKLGTLYLVLFTTTTVMLFISYGIFGAGLTGEKTVLFRFYFITLYEENIFAWVSWLLRFYLAILGMLFILVTCSERDFIVASRMVHLPYFLSFIVSITFRGLSTFVDDVQMVIQAQKGRGLDIDKLPLIKKIQRYMVVLIPLLVIEIRRSEDMANAADSRGFSLQSKKQRTDYMKAKHEFKRRDELIIAITLIVILVAFMSNFVDFRILFAL